MAGGRPSGGLQAAAGAILFLKSCSIMAISADMFCVAMPRYHKKGKVQSSRLVQRSPQHGEQRLEPTYPIFQLPFHKPNASERTQQKVALHGSP